MRPLLLPTVAVVLLVGCPSSNTPGADDAGRDAATALDAISTADAFRAEDAALDARPSFDAPVRGCALNSECAIRSASCCGSCGAATATDFIAVPTADLAGVASAICEAEGNPGCPECARPDDPFLAAVCRASSCVGLDLRLEPLTECATPTDCVLAPRQCCECGLVDATRAIAYNPARGNVQDYVCDDGTACPPCVPTYVSGVTASCVAGRCVVFGPD